MLGDIKAFFELILDRSKSLGFKTAFIISIIGVFFIIDNCFNITYNIYITNKLSNLESVNNLKDVYRSDSVQYNKLLKIESRLLNRQYYLDFLKSRLSIIEFSFTPTPLPEGPPVAPKRKPIKKETLNNHSERSLFWMIFSSSFTLVIVFPILLFLPLLGKDKITGSIIVGWFASLIIATACIIFITWTAYQIPIIFKNPLWNYILNAIIHTFFVGIIVNLSTNKKKN